MAENAASRRGDAGQHGIVRALDARHVHEACGTADEHTAGEGELRDRLPAALAERAGPISDALAALEGAANGRMGLEALELAVGRQVGIGIVQVHDKADRHQVGAIVIEEGAAPGAVVERPAERVLDQPGPVRLGTNLPQLLEPKPIFLRLAALLEAEFGHQLFGERAARALGNDRVLAFELHAAGEAVRRLAVLADPHISSGDADHRTLVVVKHLGGGKARIDLDAQSGGLLAQPAAEIAEADDVVAVVAHQRRHDEIGDAQGPGWPEIVEAVLAHRRLDGGALGLPVRYEPVEADGIDDGARQNVRPDLRALLQHHHRQLAAGRRGELLELDGGGKPGGTRPDDHHIEVHCLARRKIGCVRHRTAPNDPSPAFDRSGARPASSAVVRGRRGADAACARRSR